MTIEDFARMAEASPFFEGCTADPASRKDYEEAMAKQAAMWEDFARSTEGPPCPPLPPTLQALSFHLSVTDRYSLFKGLREYTASLEEREEE